MKYSFGKRQYIEGKSCWVDVDIKSHKIKKPTIICFGGNFTINDKSANGMAKIAESLVGDISEIDLISIKYTSEDNKKGRLALNEELEIIDNLFIPLVLGKDEKPLPVEQAMGKLRNVNMFSYCFGARRVIPELEKLFAFKLRVLGYSNKEIGSMLKQVFVAGYIGGKNIDYMSTFLVKPIFDPHYGQEYFEEVLNSLKFEDSCIDYDQMAKKTKQKEKCIKFLKEHGYFLHKQKNHLSLYATNIVKDDTEHEIINILRASSPFLEKKTSIGKAVTKALSTAMIHAATSSLISDSYNVPMPISMIEMQEQCEEILKNHKICETENTKKKN